MKMRETDNKQAKQTKKKTSSLVYVLIFILGALIALYPAISNYYYRIEANNEIQDYSQKIEDMPSEEILHRIELANIYNSMLDPSKLVDPYGKEEKEEAVAEYARMLEVQEKIGFVEIPAIGEALPIYAGTSESILQKGVGHLEGTSLPVGGENTHAVITAHRGLPQAKLFTDLDKMVEGDVFYIHVLDQVLAYKVDQILTVEPTNFEPVLVIPGGDYATLLTCTPYMINTHRLLVRGYRIPYTPPVEEPLIKLNPAKMDFRLPLAIALVVIVILVRQIRRYRKYLKARREGSGE